MTETGEAPELLLVTGMSGAGKTAATASLDDLGWFVVDNLPPSLLMELVDTVTERTPHRRIAVVADVRGGVFFGELRGALDELAARGLRPHVLFLEAGDEALVRRFESARRPHPLQGEGRVLEGIKREREQLAELRAGADLVVDTSLLNVHELAGGSGRPSRGRTRVCVPSWCRSGSSTAYRSTPMSSPTCASCRTRTGSPNCGRRPDGTRRSATTSSASPWPRSSSTATRNCSGSTSDGYLREGKRFVTVGVGCTGGKHRSVAMSEALATRLRDQGIETLVVHRDLGRE